MVVRQLINPFDPRERWGETDTVCDKQHLEILRISVHRFCNSRPSQSLRLGMCFQVEHSLGLLKHLGPHTRSRATTLMASPQGELVAV